MNIFIYDGFLSDKKYNNVLSKVETRITDLGLSGKIVRLGLLKNILATIDSEIKRGAKTLIAVGNNNTLNKVLNSVYASQHPNAFNIPLFIIPIGKKNNEIAKNLGIDNFLNACEVLSSRRISDINIIKANNTYFLSEAVINNIGSKIELDKKFIIEPLEQGEIIINNLNLNSKNLPKKINAHPSDNKVELFIKIKKEKEIKTAFIFKELIVESKNQILILDKSVKIKPPVVLILDKNKIKLIVGKNRTF